MTRGLHKRTSKQQLCSTWPQIERFSKVPWPLYIQNYWHVYSLCTNVWQKSRKNLEYIFWTSEFVWFMVLVMKPKTSRCTITKRHHHHHQWKFAVYSEKLWGLVSIPSCLGMLQGCGVSVFRSIQHRQDLRPYLLFSLCVQQEGVLLPSVCPHLGRFRDERGKEGLEEDPGGPDYRHPVWRDQDWGEGMWGLALWFCCGLRTLSFSRGLCLWMTDTHTHGEDPGQHTKGWNWKSNWSHCVWNTFIMSC